MTPSQNAARLGVTLLLVAFALLVQRWYGWDDGLELGGTDAVSYEAIALAAPEPPAEKLSFHHAQRWPGPYAVGLAAKLFGAGVRPVFAWATGACLLGAVLLLHAALARARLAAWMHAVCMALFVFHYSLRFYLLAPGMLPDALFIAGLALTLCGLAGARLRILLAGVLVAGLARQTVLLLIPGVAYWLLFGESWVQRSMAARLAGTLLASGLAIAAYVGTGFTAAPFAEPPDNLAAVTGLFSWVAGPNFSAADLAVFACYAAVPLLIPAAMLASGLWRGASWSGGLVACLLLAAAIASQPLLGGPEYTQNGNAMRLAALGFAPLVLAVGMLLKESGSMLDPRNRASPVMLLLGMGSLHYNYTLVGPRTPEEFAAVQLAVAVLAGWLMFRRPP